MSKIGEKEEETDAPTSVMGLPLLSLVYGVTVKPPFAKLTVCGPRLTPDGPPPVLMGEPEGEKDGLKKSDRTSIIHPVSQADKPRQQP